MPAPVERIGIAIVEHADRFLVGVRGEDSPLPGMAEFPGGKCQPEESPRDCALRECKEETGLAIQTSRLLDQRTHDYAHGTLELHFWLCQPIRPQEIKENHQGFRWVKREELASLEFPSANREVLDLLTK